MIHIYTPIRNYIFKTIINPITYKFFTKRLHILNSIDSIEYIIMNKCSISRFGDGEFFVMMGKGNGFQSPNAKLAEALIRVLVSDEPNHRCGIPLPLKDLSNLKEYPYFFWNFFTGRNYWVLKKYLSNDKLYLNTQLSRFYMDYVDKSNCKKQFELLKSIWQDRDIVIVEGNESRSGIGNDLFDNAKSIQRILGPAKNAFDQYDEMLQAIKDHVSKDKLILLSYGMTATVLAYDLAKLGYWAVDLGHLDLEYEWYLHGAEEKQVVAGKFTNEVQGGNEVAACTDPEYLSQIIVDITK